MNLRFLSLTCVERVCKSHVSISFFPEHTDRWGKKLSIFRWWDVTKIFIVKAVWENTSFQEDKLIPDIKLCSAEFGNVLLQILGLFYHYLL